MSKEKILHNLYQAYYTARKNKVNSKDKQLFEIEHEQRLHLLCESICDRTYVVSPCKAFVIEKPVCREIFAPQFVDRVVHHLVAQYLLPVLEGTLIQDAYSCRTGKGTSYGVKRATYFMRSVTGNYAKDAYVLKLDISGYFMNINHVFLYEKIKSMKLVEHSFASNYEKEILDFLIQKIIFTSPVQNCVRTGDKSLWKFVPNNKSLFYSPDACGLPIGNLTSQLFANIYLNAFDHWIKNELGMNYYGRYVDDMIWMHEDKEKLKELTTLVSQKLKSIGLDLHPKKIYPPAGASVPPRWRERPARERVVIKIAIG